LEKYGTSRQDTDDNTAGRMDSACRITKARDPDSENVKFISFDS